MPDRRSLSDYRAKRRFDETPEPEGGTPAEGAALSFVVQKHDATRLHWDFRLEWQGVLLSWAVTRGPSPDPGQKRLAVRTEDHPLDYAAFEGTIPKGNYGAGTVMLWDRGTWQPLHDVDAGLAQGKLHFTLDGARMRGGWALVRLRGKREEKRENWLLVKESDADALEDPEALVRDHMTSVTTGRDMAAIAAGEGDRRRTRPNPAFHPPQLAQLATRIPEGGDWWHEVKLDGYRGQISLGQDGVRLFSRSGADWSDRFAPLSPAAARLPCDSALLDGEVMAEDGTFSGLRQALGSGGPLLFYAFDLLHLDGRDLTALPLSARREALEALLATQPERGAIRLSPALSDGPALLRDICAAGGEGIVAKRRDAPYAAGRSPVWTKVKCGRRAEFVILGYLPSTRPGRPFASIFLGSVEEGAIHYRGKVGTGFDDRDFREMVALFTPLHGAVAPADAPRAETRGAVWLRPELVAETRFAEYTADGRIRHGVFLGIREDKPAMQVSAEGAPEDKPDSPVAGITITSPTRLVFPDCGVTKRAFARYHEAMAAPILASLADRPLAFVRHPDGIEGKGFFQKHKTEGWPDAIRTFPTEEDHALYLTDAAGLVAAVQMGVVEFHLQGVHRDRTDRPDRLVFDLDPDEGVGFPDLVSAATDLRDALAGMGLPTQPMVTGGKGLHLVARLTRRQPQETVADFARSLARWVAEQEPERFVATMSKARRKDRIFIDWLRNQRGATAVAPWTVRARPGARVAVPVEWDDLPRLHSAREFGMEAAMERSQGWKDEAEAVSLTPALRAMARLEGAG
jgi:bifunctional non-homologous end joining protein LigD